MSKDEPANDLYVGYLPVSGTQRTFLRAAAIILLVLAPIAGAGLAAFQRDPGSAVWNIDEVVQLTGTLIEQPYPMLIQREPGRPERAILLVSEGKFGAADRVRGMDGRKVAVRGTTLTRQGMLLLELTSNDDAVMPMGPASAEVEPEQLGTRQMDGEIIDPKCYFGAMKPGEGKTHKGCAVLCIRGGIPPVFATRDPSGKLIYFLVADHEGNPANEMVIPFVGEPVRVSGELESRPGIAILRINPLDIHSN